MADQLRDIVQRMVDAGESEQDIALVIQRLSHETPKPDAPTGLPGNADTQKLLDENPAFRKTAESIMGGGMTGALTNVAKPMLGMGEKVARRIYSGLLKPKQGLKDSFGGSQEIAGTLLNERAPITRGGLAKVTSRLGQSRDKALGMVKEAEAAGTPGVGPKDVISEFAPVIKELRKRIDIGQADNMAQVGDRGRAILRTTGQGGGTIPLTRAQALKETAQDASSGAYRALERGAQKQLSADDLLDTAVARGLKGGIEKQVPGVAAQNLRSQSLIGGKRGLEDALEREGNTLGIGGAKDFLATAIGGGALAAGAGPAAIPIALGARAMTTPSTGSMGAILLNELSKKGILDASTRAALLTMLNQRSNP